MELNLFQVEVIHEDSEISYDVLNAIENSNNLKIINGKTVVYDNSTTFYVASSVEYNEEDVYEEVEELLDYDGVEFQELEVEMVETVEVDHIEELYSSETSIYNFENDIIINVIENEDEKSEEYCDEEGEEFDEFS